MLLVFQGCGEPKEPKEVILQSVEIKDVLKLDESSADLPDSLMFVSPYLTAVNSKGDIYMLDMRQKVIFHFDSSGVFKNVFGGEGRGPGEFESVYELIPVNDSSLLVYDYMQARFTIFDSSGEVQRIVNMDFHGRAVSHIRQLSDEELLFTVFQDGKLLQVYNLEEEKITQKGLVLENLLQTSHEHEPVFLASASGTALAVTENRIVYTPQYYNGKLDVYEKSGSDWVFVNKITGFTIDESFTIHESKTERPKEAKTTTVHPEGEGFLGLEYHSESLGLFYLKDNKFAHISYRDINPEKKEQKLIYEIFDGKDGRLEKVVEIDSLKTSVPPRNLPVWIDREGYLYVIDNPENPTLRKIEVLWKN